MQPTTKASTPTYLIHRHTKHRGYSIWKLDIDRPSLFSKQADVRDTFPVDNKIIPIGDFLLSYKELPSPSGPLIGYSLFQFDPESPNPLNAQPVQASRWDLDKFLGAYTQFTWDHNNQNILQLIPISGYVLAWMPTTARSTFQLWNFDPASSISGADPLPNKIFPQDAFPVISDASELLPIGGDVLEWHARNSAYRVWSFDPQKPTPLSLPTLSEGVFADIDERHRLIVLGEYILDWVPSDRSYRLWGWDSSQPCPLIGPLREGRLSPEFTPTSILTALQKRIPINPDNAEIPGTIDFMREKIKHVIVYMLESRSFDSVLGWLYDHQPDNVNWVHASPPFMCNSTSYSNHAIDKTWPVYIYEDGALGQGFNLDVPSIDPFHGYADSIKHLWSNGSAGYLANNVPDMGGFVANNCDGSVMVSYGPNQLSVLNGLAGEFAVCDYWFSALPAGTDCNRAFALSGSSFNLVNTYEGGDAYKNFPNTPRRQSIFKSLWVNGVTDWCIYYSVQWLEEVFTYQLYLRGQIPTVDQNIKNYVKPMDKFFNQAASGTLPAFSFLEPTWIAPEGSTSYHPQTNLVLAERYLNKIYEAIANGPGWEQSLLLITFSKGGGMYDHVPPPAAINPWPSDLNNGFRYDVFGTRVPAIVVSPYIQARTIFRSPDSDIPFSHTSTLATVLSWFGIPRSNWGLGKRVENDVTFEAVLQSDQPRSERPIMEVPYDKTYPPNSN
jgi:phospholipase C